MDKITNEVCVHSYINSQCVLDNLYLTGKQHNSWWIYCSAIWTYHWRSPPIEQICNLRKGLYIRQVNGKKVLETSFFRFYGVRKYCISKQEYLLQNCLVLAWCLKFLKPHELWLLVFVMFWSFWEEMWNENRIDPTFHIIDAGYDVTKWIRNYFPISSVFPLLFIQILRRGFFLLQYLK